MVPKKLKNRNIQQQKEAHKDTYVDYRIPDEKAVVNKVKQ